MELPDRVRYVLSRLETAGFSAYAVGGCVRDSLLGLVPKDWDMCTSALPAETEAVFSGLPVLETGLKHGTVTVLLDREPFEITTFRRDGDYSDHRTPDRVEFVEDLTEDLARRDFTVGAMAVGLDGVIRDPFGGREDLEHKVLRCVGDPDRRFQEDALRILRGMRFASQLRFTVESATAAAMVRNRDLLTAVSPERIYKELCGLLTGPGCASVLETFGEVLRAVLPEIGPSMGFSQHSPYHDKDVWGHTVEAVGYSGEDLWVRWALLLHDLGKPETFTLDENGVGHFKGHPARSEAIAREIFARLHGDSATRDAVCQLVRDHDAYAPINRKNVRRWLARYGRDQFFRLMEVMRADAAAHVDTPNSRIRREAIGTVTDMARELLTEAPCLTIQDLAVNGRDVLALGVPAGPRVGELLNLLFEDVLEERCPNDREVLLDRLAQYRKEDTPWSST